MPTERISQLITDLRALEEQVTELTKENEDLRCFIGMLGDLARKRVGQDKEVDPVKNLKPVYRSILRLLAESRTSKEIARVIGISLSTVGYHKDRLKRELNLRSRADLLKFALENEDSLRGSKPDSQESPSKSS